MNGLCLDITTHERLQKALCKFKHILVKCGFSHSCEMHIETICMLNVFFAFKNSLYLVIKVSNICVSVIPESGAIAKLTSHRATFLGADCGYPLVSKVYLGIGNSIDFFM